MSDADDFAFIESQFDAADREIKDLREELAKFQRGRLPWRQGRKVPQNIYDADDRPIVMMPTPELAALVVSAVNAHDSGGGE